MVRGWGGGGGLEGKRCALDADTPRRETSHRNPLHNGRQPIVASMGMFRGAEERLRGMDGTRTPKTNANT